MGIIGSPGDLHSFYLPDAMNPEEGKSHNAVNSHMMSSLCWDVVGRVSALVGGMAVFLSS